MGPHVTVELESAGEQRIVALSRIERRFGPFSSGLSTHDFNFGNNLLEWDAPCTYPRGTTIYQQGFLAERPYYIEQGLVKLTAAEFNGHQVVVGLRRKNWILATSAVILESRYSATATTLTKCTLRSANSAWFRDRLRNDKELSFEIIRMLSREIQHDFARLITLGCLDARERLRKFLCEIIREEYLSEKQMSQEFDIPLKNREISEITGVTPEHISRLLRQMECDGLVRRIGRRLTVVCPIDFLCRTAVSD